MENIDDRSLLLQVKKIKAFDLRHISTGKNRTNRIKRTENSIILSNEERTNRYQQTSRLNTEVIFSTPQRKPIKKIPTIDLSTYFQFSEKIPRNKPKLAPNNLCKLIQFDHPKFRISTQNTNYDHYLYQVLSNSPKKVITNLQSSQQYTKPQSAIQIPKSINQSLLLSCPKKCKFLT